MPAMKVERSFSSSLSSDYSMRNSIKEDPNSSPNSVFRRLCQKLFPKKSPKKNSSISYSGSQNCNEDMIQRVFNYFDKDEDGRISPSELQSCMKIVGGGAELSLIEAEMAVQSSDSDGDGLLDLEDFANLIEGSESEDEELTAAFGMYTAEGTASITPKSLKRMLSRLGQSTSVDNCKEMIRKFDLNGDGVLNFDEFRVMMR